MIKNILQSIEGVAVWPIVSLSIFFIFFIVLTIWVVGVDKRYINKMKQLPMDEESDKS